MVTSSYDPEGLPTPLTNDNQPTIQRERSIASSFGWRTHAIYGSVAFVVVLADQLSKVLIWDTVGPAGDRVQILVTSWLRIIFVRNSGGSFGMFQGQSSILTVLSILALFALGALFYRNARQDGLVAVALGLIVGGALGNLIDRIRLGYVIDWIDVPRWPTFNIADSAITVGVTLLIFALLFRDQHHERAEGERDIATSVVGEARDS